MKGASKTATSKTDTSNTFAVRKQTLTLMHINRYQPHAVTPMTIMCPTCLSVSNASGTGLEARRWKLVQARLQKCGDGLALVLS